MAKPLIPADDILDRALQILDSDGLEALTVRRLAADLKISPRTLYQQVGNQEAMVRTLVAKHFLQLKLEFREHETWESTALHWCLSLNKTLGAHPFLTELMTIDDRAAVSDYVDALLKSSLHEGIPRKLAVECCRGLANITINHSITEVRARREAAHSPETAAEIVKVNKNFRRVVQWVIAAVRAEASQASARKPTTHAKRVVAKRA